MGCRRLGQTAAARVSRPKVVLLVGGSVGDAELCAREAAPVPVVRSTHLGTAMDRLRSMKPLLVVVAPEIEGEDASIVRRVAEERSVRVVELPGPAEAGVIAHALPRR